MEGVVVLLQLAAVERVASLRTPCQPPPPAGGVQIAHRTYHHRRSPHQMRNMVGVVEVTAGWWTISAAVVTILACVVRGTHLRQNCEEVVTYHVVVAKCCVSVAVADHVVVQSFAVAVVRGHVDRWTVHLFAWEVGVGLSCVILRDHGPDRVLHVAIHFDPSWSGPVHVRVHAQNDFLHDLLHGVVDEDECGR